jgi:hypothetical protein
MADEEEWKGVTFGDYTTPSPKPLNGKQFSQLSLFNIKPEGPGRWPKGYTPERQAEVAAAIPAVEVSHHNDPIPNRPGMFLSSKTHFTPSEDDPHQGTWAGTKESRRAAGDTHGRNMITETIARSSIPSEDLQALPTFHVQNLQGAGGDYGSPGFPANEMKSNRQGGYVPDPESMARGRIRIDPNASRAWNEHTLIHEIGHHVDYLRSPQEFEDAPQVLTSRGGIASPLLEGAAEGYAAAHHVPRRDAPDGSYAANASYKEFHGHPEFEDRFRDVSGKSVTEAMGPSPFSLGNRNMGQQFGGQARLFVRSADRSETEAPGYQDYGQHKLRIDWDEGQDLDTIKLGRGVAAHGLEKK